MRQKLAVFILKSPKKPFVLLHQKFEWKVDGEVFLTGQYGILWQ